MGLKAQDAKTKACQRRHCSEQKVRAQKSTSTLKRSRRTVKPRLFSVPVRLRSAVSGPVRPPSFPLCTFHWKKWRSAVSFYRSEPFAAAAPPAERQRSPRERREGGEGEGTTARSGSASAFPLKVNRKQWKYCSYAGDSCASSVYFPLGRSAETGEGQEVDRAETRSLKKLQQFLFFH